MKNRVISYSFMCFKVPAIIIILGENVFGPKYIDIYFWGGLAGVGVIWFTLHFLFIIHKNRKSTRA